ncbi:MAG: sensor histidine kinase [Candidatus Methylomirabilales bacterium]
MPVDMGARPGRSPRDEGRGALARRLSADFTDELQNARRRVAVLEEANRAIQESLDRITRLSAFSEGLDRSGSVEDVGCVLFEEMRGILPARAMLLALLDADGRAFRPLRAEPAEAEAAVREDLQAQAASGVLAWAVGLRRPTMVAGAQPGANLVLVPLATGRRAVGILLVTTDLPADAVEQQQLLLVAVLARQAAECIDNLLLTEKARRQSELVLARRIADLGLLVETARTVSARLEGAEVLRVVVQAAAQHLGVRAAAIWTRQPDGGFVVASQVGLPAAGVPDALLARVAERRAPVSVAELSGEPGAPADPGDGEEQQRAVARLVQSSRMASVGLLAGGIAHDINNPLCIISNHLQLLRLQPLPPRLLEPLATLESCVDRISQSIQTLLDYAQGRPGDRRATDLNESVRRILLLLQYHPVCRRLRVQKDLAPELPLVQLDRGAWEQALLELFLNAREATAEDGRVRVRTRRLPGGPGDADRVQVEVEDDGVGISAEHMPLVFNPFFTTKPAKRGMGIGLKICRDIIEAHGGRLTVEPGAAGGTRVVIQLPAAEAESETT